jgi:hypothetical protein
MRNALAYYTKAAWKMARCGSTMVEQSTYNLKVEGSNLAVTTEIHKMTEISFLNKIWEV